MLCSKLAGTHKAKGLFCTSVTDSTFCSSRPNQVRRPCTDMLCCCNAAIGQFLAPDIIALVTCTAKGTSPAALQEQGMQQFASVTIMVCGYFYALAGRAEAEWFFCASIIDRVIAYSIAIVMVLIGRLPPAMGVLVTVVDLGSALVTYYLYSKHMAQKEGKQQR